jgi:DNA repair protein RecO (recombination protein O)
VVVLLTEHHGVVHAVAKGAKRLANGFLGPLDTGVLYRMRIGRRGGDGLCHLHTGAVRDPYARLRSDPARFHAAALVVEVASDLMRENEPHVELFRLTVYTLRALDRAPRDRIGLATALFLARAVRLSGHAPELDACVACGAVFDGAEMRLLSPTRGGALHLACAPGEPGAQGVTASVVALLERLWRRPAAEVLAGDAPRPDLRAARTVLVHWLEQVLERRFRGAALLEREIAAVSAGG